MAKRIGTQGTAPFVIQDTGIPQPAGHSDYNVGGPFHVSTLADLKAIPSYYLIDKSVEGLERPVWGAMGYVHSDPTPENNGRWELKKGLVDNDITNPDNWQKMGVENLTADEVTETPTRVFLTPQEKAKITLMRGIFANEADIIANIPTGEEGWYVQNLDTVTFWFWNTSTSEWVDTNKPIADEYVHPNHTGDVTSTGDGATTITNKAVTNEKLADMAANRIKGAQTSGAPKDLTAAEVREIINVENGATKNATDAQLRDRSTHTGKDPIDSLEGFDEAPNESYPAKDANGNPTWVQRSAPKAYSVVKPTGVVNYYDTLHQAVSEASNGDTVEMFSDYVSTSVINITTSITIDTNGHSIINNSERGYPGTSTISINHPITGEFVSIIGQGKIIRRSDVVSSSGNPTLMVGPLRKALIIADVISEEVDSFIDNPNGGEIKIIGNVEGELRSGAGIVEVVGDVKGGIVMNSGPGKIIIHGNIITYNPSKAGITNTTSGNSITVYGNIIRPQGSATPAIFFQYPAELVIGGAIVNDYIEDVVSSREGSIISFLGPASHTGSISTNVTVKSIGMSPGIEDIIEGTNTSIDKTDPKKPIINFTGGTSLIKATQSEAEAGINDDKYITPLKALQSIAARAGFGIVWNATTKKFELDTTELNKKVDKEDGKGLIDTTKEANIPANTNQEFTNLKGGVPEAGNTLKKLHDLIIANEGDISNILDLLESDDELLDELQEVVDFIKNNRTDLDNYVLELQNKVDKETGKGLISTTKEVNIPEDTISELAGKVDKQTNHSLISNDDLLKVESIETTGDGTKYKSDDGTYKAVLPVNFTKNVEVQLNEYSLVLTNGRALMLLHHENVVGLSVQSPDGTYPLAGITIDENEINITGTAPLLYSDTRTLVDPLELVHKAYVDALRSEFETYKKGYIINFVFKDVLEVTHTIVHDVKFLTIDAPPGVTITGLTLNELLTKGTEITITSSGSGLVIIKGEKQ